MRSFKIKATKPCSEASRGSLMYVPNQEYKEGIGRRCPLYIQQQHRMENLEAYHLRRAGICVRRAPCMNSGAGPGIDSGLLGEYYLLYADASSVNWS